MASVVFNPRESRVLGLKHLADPTRWGAIDTDGNKVTSPSLDTIGIFARCIPDLELIAGVCGIEASPIILGPRHIRACRFAFIKTDQFDGYASDDLRRVWQFAIDMLKEAGAEVVEVDLDDEYKTLGTSYGIYGKQVVDSFLAEYRADPNHPAKSLQDLVETGGEMSGKQAQAYHDHLAMLRPKFDKLARDYDAIITPSCAGEAPKKEDSNPATRFCGLWTALHVPVVAVPGFVGSCGLPIGLSLVGPRYVLQ
jgi:amidase